MKESFWDNLFGGVEIDDLKKRGIKWAIDLDGNGSSDDKEYEERNQDDKEIKERKNSEVYYGKLLGLKGSVSIEDIHKAYRNKIKEYHPDKIATMADELKELALKRTKEINEAYKYFKEKYG
tara:strand:- start:718 stop:1083 length:366 start_codon:yes stop_codon:yes gene_type:complete